MQDDIRKEEVTETKVEQKTDKPVSAEHEFYESLAASPQSYEDEYDGLIDESGPQMLPTWAIVAVLLVGFLLIIALVVALGVG